MNGGMRSTAISLVSSEIAERAVLALYAEADLTPKPGLVDRRGSGAHSDMTLDLLHRSADTLRPFIEQCASAAMDRAPGVELRAELGRIGRAGEAAMLAATGGVNTHRGALWALGLLGAAAASAGTGGGEPIVLRASELARIADPATPATDVAYGEPMSHGAAARRRYRVAGATGEACAGFPHVTRIALPVLAVARSRGADEPTARLHALLALMARLDDTCLLHRGGWPALRQVQSTAAAVLDAGGPQTALGRRHFMALDRMCLDYRWSPGGSGDLLAATIFLDSLQERVVD